MNCPLSCPPTPPPLVIFALCDAHRLFSIIPPPPNSLPSSCQFFSECRFLPSLISPSPYHPFIPPPLLHPWAIPLLCLLPLSSQPDLLPFVLPSPPLFPSTFPLPSVISCNIRAFHPPVPPSHTVWVCWEGDSSGETRD